VSAQTEVLRGFALTMAALGAALLFTLLIVLPTSPFRRNAQRYVENLDGQLRFVRSSYSGVRILGWQVVAFLFVAVAGYLLSSMLYTFELGVIFGPYFQIKQRREHRVVRLEQQLDGWLLILANALKAVPSIGDALASSQALTHAPISEELDMMLKEYRFGTPLDQALHNMSLRVNSRVITTALTMLQVARRAGGDLPSTLETAAASLRELARLEAVVRTKTADGRNQSFVVGALPAVVLVLLYFSHKDLLLPLFQSFQGNVLLAVAIAMWAGAIAISLKILKVDL
jgi:tight adherence protein B